MEVEASSGNIFEDFGFDPAEAEVLKVKAQLRAEIVKEIQARDLSQAEAAQLVGIARPAFDQLMNNKLQGISVDKMTQMTCYLGIGREVRSVRRDLVKVAPSYQQRTPWENYFDLDIGPGSGRTDGVANTKTQVSEVVRRKHGR